MVALSSSVAHAGRRRSGANGVRSYEGLPGQPAHGFAFQHMPDYQPGMLSIWIYRVNLVMEWKHSSLWTEARRSNTQLNPPPPPQDAIAPTAYQPVTPCRCCAARRQRRFHSSDVQGIFGARDGSDASQQSVAQPPLDLSQQTVVSAPEPICCATSNMTPVATPVPASSAGHGRARTDCFAKHCARADGNYA